MRLPTKDETAAVGRHAIQITATLTGMLTVLHFMTPESAASLKAAVDQIGHGVAELLAGVSAVVSLSTGAYAMWTASRASQIAAVAANPEVKQIVVNNSVTADAQPSNKVVAR
jgi:uncharacterized protein YaiL (DUF2058 family)